MINQKRIYAYTKGGIPPHGPFPGLVLDLAGLKNTNVLPNTTLYLSGNIQLLLDAIGEVKTKVIWMVEGSTNFNPTWDANLIPLGCVPIDLEVGIMFPQYFAKGFYDKLTDAHEFQSLTESNKPDKSYRKGIYLSEVKETEEGREFHLLRCSTNLDGPTDNFRKPDDQIIGNLNVTRKEFYPECTRLNHVLAQTYENVTSGGKQRKARIAEHSDKTKDMPEYGIMAFCSFYKDLEIGGHVKPSKDDKFDIVYKGKSSVLTRLKFRLKKCLWGEDIIRAYKKEFDVILYPDSVFMMPLFTNRLYTHEIIPPHLPNEKLPTRMGYVVRCSNRKAIHKDGKTYIINSLTPENSGTLTPLVEPTEEGIKKLKELYREENMTAEVIDYGDQFNFSLNEGDYREPKL